jgi:hypothetical protein
MLFAGAGVLASTAVAATLPTTAAAQPGDGGTTPPLGTRAAYRVRLRAGQRQARQGIERQHANGDEQRYATRIANFSKALPHNAFGEVQPEAYAALLKALRTGDATDFAAIPMGGTAKLANPQGALAYQLEGAEASALALPPAPRFSSLVQAGEAVELYWRALARDIPFAGYVGNATVAAAVTDLRRFPGFESVGAATLFRGNLPGDQVGPHISQFLWLDIPYGGNPIHQLYFTNTPGIDHLTDFAAFLTVQNGGAPVSPEAFESEPRYILNGRDLAAWVHRDFTCLAFLNAALILLGYGPAALDPANPYLNGGFENQGAFCTFGGPALTLGGEVNKLAANVSFGRDFAGIHWRSDGVEGLRLGEQVALRLLQDAARLPVEPFEGFSLTTFDGEMITI